METRLPLCDGCSHLELGVSLLPRRIFRWRQSRARLLKRKKKEVGRFSIRTQLLSNTLKLILLGWLQKKWNTKILHKKEHIPSIPNLFDILHCFLELSILQNYIFSPPSPRWESRVFWEATFCAHELSAFLSPNLLNTKQTHIQCFHVASTTCNTSAPALWERMDAARKKNFFWLEM